MPLASHARQGIHLSLQTIHTLPEDRAYQIKTDMLRVQQFSQVVNGAGCCPALAAQSCWRSRHHSKPPFRNMRKGEWDQSRSPPLFEQVRPLNNQRPKFREAMADEGRAG